MSASRTRQSARFRTQRPRPRLRPTRPRRTAIRAQGSGSCSGRTVSPHSRATTRNAATHPAIMIIPPSGVTGPAHLKLMAHAVNKTAAQQIHQHAPIARKDQQEDAARKQKTPCCNRPPCETMCGKSRVQGHQHQPQSVVDLRSAGRPRTRWRQTATHRILSRRLPCVNLVRDNPWSLAESVSAEGSSDHSDRGCTRCQFLGRTTK